MTSLQRVLGFRAQTQMCRQAIQGIFGFQPILVMLPSLPVSLGGGPVSGGNQSAAGVGRSVAAGQGGLQRGSGSSSLPRSMRHATPSSQTLQAHEAWQGTSLELRGALLCFLARRGKGSGSSLVIHDTSHIQGLGGAQGRRWGENHESVGQRQALGHFWPWEVARATVSAQITWTDAPDTVAAADAPH